MRPDATRRGASDIGWSERVQRLFPAPRSDQAAAHPGEVEAYAALDLPDGSAGRPYVVANMVSTVDGKVALRGKARGIGSRVDRRLMRLIRAQVDALLVGAATLRSEIVDPRVDPDLATDRVERGEPAHPLAVTVTRSLELDPRSRFFMLGPERSLIITTTAAARERGAAFAEAAQLLTTDGDEVDLATALAELRRDWGVRRLLCEGGPRLAQRLLELGLLDELFWTIAPKLAGGNGLGLLDSAEPADRIRANLRLISLFEHAGELFARYRVGPPAV